MLKGEIALTPTRPTPPVVGGGSGNLALHRPTAESSHTQIYVSGNAVDGDAGSYWRERERRISTVDTGAYMG